MTILIRERRSEHCIHRIREVEVKSDEQYVCNSRRNLELREIEICYVCMRLGGFKHLFADTDKFRSLPKNLHLHILQFLVISYMVFYIICLHIFWSWITFNLLKTIWKFIIFCNKLNYYAASPFIDKDNEINIMHWKNDENRWK